MEVYNKNIEKILAVIPIDNLLRVIQKAILSVGDGTKIERHDLGSILRYEIPNIRINSYPYNKITLTKEESHSIIQEFLSQDYLTFSDNNPNPKTELYFELGEKAKKNLI
ncbi:MAG: hypothetical protein V1815_02335 [Candidatus Woesearchaeota archaeon]